MENSEKNTIPKIVSFLFPIVGLIIYATNIGGNNKKLANDCLKYAIISIIIAFSIVIIIVYIVPLIFGTKTTTIQGNRIENTTITEEKINLTEEEKQVLLNGAEEFYNNTQSWFDYKKKTTISVKEMIVYKYIPNDYDYLSTYKVKISLNDTKPTFTIIKTN